MNPLVAVLIASLTCGTPPLKFRDFFHDYYLPSPSAANGLALRGETADQAVSRLMNATADYSEYRAVWMDQCGVRR